MTEEFTKKYKIQGMHCVSCAMLIEGALEDANIVDEASCTYASSELTVKARTQIDNTAVSQAVQKLGYSIVPII
jgi:copper chaperone CopZ